MNDSIKRKILAGFAFYTCHKIRQKTKLLDFQNRRDNCRKRLWEAGRKYEGAILNYHISPEKLQILATGNSIIITNLMTTIATNTAKDHSRNTKMEGPFWKGRFNAVFIQHGIHLLRSSLTMNMTMILQGKCLYPEEWNSSGYREITGIRKRYRIVNSEKCAKLSGFQNKAAMQAWHIEQMNTVSEIVMLNPEDLITAVSIGDLENMELMAHCFPRRQREIKLCCSDKFGSSYGLFVSGKAKRVFTRSLT